MIKPITGYPGYFVSDAGYVIGKYGRKIGAVTKAGYEIVCLLNEDGSRVCLTHRLVAEYFVSGRDEEHDVVDHRDGNKLNNAASNLRWTTRSLNLLYAYNEQKIMPERQRPRKVIARDTENDVFYTFDSIHAMTVALGMPYWPANNAYHRRQNRTRVGRYEIIPVAER